MSEPDDKPDPLTSREREVLEGILDHKTAKQMGLEHGVSHHAIEKRLKRARQKLGADSSLDAAKLYRDRYGRSVSGSPELERADDPGAFHSEPARTGFWTHRKRIIAMLTLTILAAGAYAVSSTADQPATAPSSRQVERALEGELVKADTLFRSSDRDGSGFIERSEFVFSPAMASINIGNLPESVDLDAAALASTKRRAAMFAIFDRDDDGRIDPGEFSAGYLEGMGPRHLELDAPEITAQDLPASYSTRIGITVRSGQDVHRTAFKMADRDRSGAIDLDEFVNLSPLRRETTSERSPDQVAAATKIFRFMDSDESGTIDRNEFATVVFTDDDGNSYEFEVFDKARG